ncbi:MAG: YajQ family cyclic di-GMP-binding protein [Candidatus Sumerlaeia bacterium]|nr:YajQ family cyclic di-GMP-binding protein [Candidatus Sumerlaeia bacterium]
MPTFDIVSKLDMQLVDNAVNTATARITQRFDFRGVKITLELDKKAKTLKVEAPDDMKMKHMQEVVRGCFIDQGVSPKAIEWGTPEYASLGGVRHNCKLQDGLEKEMVKKVNGIIKDSGLKVKATTQGEQVRVESKSIDDLQAVMRALEEANLPVPLQYVNMKR